MTDTKNTDTHTAYAFKRLGRKHGKLLECGTGRIDHDRNIAHVFLDRQPWGGGTGYVVLSPIGVKLPPTQAEPQRPGDDGDDTADPVSE
jgi:hypothetical protein